MNRNSPPKSCLPTPRSRPTFLYTHPERELSTSNGSILAAPHERLRGKPLQYILNHRIYGRPFRVTPVVLIPARDRTRRRTRSHRCPWRPPHRDVCTGSGILATRSHSSSIRIRHGIGTLHSRPSKCGANAVALEAAVEFTLRFAGPLAGLRLIVATPPMSLPARLTHSTAKSAATSRASPLTVALMASTPIAASSPKHGFVWSREAGSSWKSASTKAPQSLPFSPTIGPVSM